MRQAWIALFVLLLALPSLAANPFVELNAFYFSDTFVVGTSSQSTSMFIEGAAGLGIDKKKTYMIGWGYSMYSVTTAGTASVKYSSTRMGPRFVWRIGKAQNWTLGLGYNLITNATYDDGSGSSLKWEGTALKADFGYGFDISENSQLGFRMNYSSVSYAEQLDAADDYSKISNTRSQIFPSVYYFWAL